MFQAGTYDTTQSIWYYKVEMHTDFVRFHAVLQAGGRERHDTESPTRAHLERENTKDE